MYRRKNNKNCFDGMMMGGLVWLCVRRVISMRENVGRGWQCGSRGSRIEKKLKQNVNLLFEDKQNIIEKKEKGVLNLNL